MLMSFSSFPLLSQVSLSDNQLDGILDLSVIINWRSEEHVELNLGANGITGVEESDAKTRTNCSMIFLFDNAIAHDPPGNLLARDDLVLAF